MDYEQFITEIQKYWDLRKKGLKKQANSFMFAFTKDFKDNRDGDFYELCKKEGIVFERIPVIYYKG